MVKPHSHPFATRHPTLKHSNDGEQDSTLTPYMVRPSKDLATSSNVTMSARSRARACKYALICPVRHDPAELYIAQLVVLRNVEIRFTGLGHAA